MKSNYGRILTTAVIAIILMATVSIPAFASFQSDYDKALAQFRSAKAKQDYQTAAAMFAELTDNKEAGKLEGNVLFWLAECYYGMKDYVKALNTFEHVLLLPRSYKEEDARYKVAVCYVRLEWNDAARWELTRFLRDFPSSQKADYVRKELNRLPAVAGGR